MKKLLSLFILVFLVLSCNFNQSQPSISEPTEHLRFKGYEITGAVSAFADSLISDGYRINKKATSEKTIVLEGEFAGQKDCLLTLSATPISGTIYDVGVLTQHNSWNSSIVRYNSLKSALTEKYGEPYEVEEDMPEKSKGLEDTMFEWGLASYSTTYIIDSGSIILSINYSHKRFVVNALYIDSEGANLYKQENNQQLSTEL